MTMTLENQVRADSIVEMNKGMLKVVLDTFKIHGLDPQTQSMITKIHGLDPQTQSMITAALYMTILDLDKVFPGTKLVVKEMLKNEKG
jgi:hypothetical protein